MGRADGHEWKKIGEHERGTPVSRGRGRGRPMKCTQIVRVRLLNGLRKGWSIKKSCEVAGIGASTFHRWKAIGKGETGFFRDLLDEVKLAMQDGGKRYIMDYYDRRKGEVEGMLLDVDEYEEAFESAIEAGLTDEEGEALAERYDAGLPINGVSPKQE